MIDRKRILRVAVILGIAGGVSYAMQNGIVFASQGSGVKARTPEKLENEQQQDHRVLSHALPTPPQEAIAPPELGPPEQGTGPSWRVVSARPGVPLGLLQETPTPAFSGEACHPDIGVTAEPGAMLALELSAPCHAGERILIEHENMRFADVVDATGNYTSHLPALSESGPVTVTFADGSSVSEGALTFTLDGYSRVGIAWAGAAALNIHAFEFGAGFGDAGHVWADAPRSPEYGVHAKGGFLTRLGNPDVFNPQMAEVYSFPFGRMPEEGTIQIRVEAAITQASCGKAIEGQEFELASTGAMAITSLSLSMPPCDGALGFLVLNNLLQDMKIAHN